MIFGDRSRADKPFRRPLIWDGHHHYKPYNLPIFFRVLSPKTGVRLP